MSKPADDSINKHLHYDRPIFTDQVMPKGELTLEPLCHACWYYLMLAQKNKEQVGKGPESQIITVDTWSSEQPLWHEKTSEERRVGNECVSTCRSRWSPTTSKNRSKQDLIEETG